MTGSWWRGPDTGPCSNQAQCLIDAVPAGAGWAITWLAPAARPVVVSDRPGPIRAASGEWFVTNESGSWVAESIPRAPTFGSMATRDGRPVVFGAETDWNGARRFERTATGWSVTQATTAGEYPAFGAIGPDGTEHLVWGEGTWTPAGGFTGRTVLQAPDRIAPTAGRPLVRLATGSTVGSTVHALIFWPAADRGGSGLARFKVDMRTNGGAWTRINSSTTVPSISRTLNSGTATTYQFRVQALDRAGNASPLHEGPVLRLPVVQETNAAFTYTGTWRTARPTGASGGSTRYATAANASATYAFRGRGFSLVAPMGPAHGSIDVWLDGKLVKTVSLYSSVYRPRIVAYSTAWNVWTTHTVKLVVKGTAGHPRVDVDAAVLGG